MKHPGYIGLELMDPPYPDRFYIDLGVPSAHKIVDSCLYRMGPSGRWNIVRTRSFWYDYNELCLRYTKRGIKEELLFRFWRRLGAI